MPFTDAVSSISGRNSRASNVSGATEASRSLRSPLAFGSGNDAMANAGVLSMLKTSTDTGDIGALSFNTSRLPAMPAHAQQRRLHASRPSGNHHSYHPSSAAHHRYAPSATSRVSSTIRDWDDASNGRQGSLTSMQTMPTYVSDTHSSIMGPQSRHHGPLPPPPPARLRNSRSYSLTNAQLPRLKSEHSLKSQGHEPRYYAAHPPPMPENRPQFVYPTRLKRPGYRSPSPALGDTYAQQYSQPLAAPPLMARRPTPAISRRPMPMTFNSDYGAAEYNADLVHFEACPPPRGMSVSPVLTYPRPHPHYAYRPAPVGTAPALHMQQTGHRVPVQGLSHSHLYAQQRAVPLSSHYGSHHPGSYQPGHGQVILPQYQSRRLPPAAQPHLGPGSHHMFHNATRTARQLPQRTGTPLTDLGPPSSDPPSSGGTAQTPSSPHTPQDQTTIHIAVDPAFIDPALTDLPESTSDPVIPAKYFDYVDGLEKAIDESDIEIHHPSVPPSGFVQRVKAMLELKAAAEAADKTEADRDYDRPVIAHHVELQDYHHQFDNSRMTVIHEFQAPVELPASPVKIAELEASPARSVRRLTRELVKAELAMTMTDEGSTVQFKAPSLHREGEDSTTHESSADPQFILPLDDEPTTTTDLPSSPPIHIERKASVSESAASCSVRSSRDSGMDYAFRFSVPNDETTNLGQTETESRDPFALDADTITVQHQEAKESTSRIPTSEPAKEPVSPLKLDEDVGKHSDVSPMQTQTLGLGETLRMTATDLTIELKSDVASTSTIDDEQQPPPTPRTPRTYSKSVNLPNASTTMSDSVSTNRLSLPVDLSQLGDTTDTTIDAMTDVAVRFSMPQTTVTIGKPHIVYVSSSSPSSQIKEENVPLKPALSTSERRTTRGSVTSEDKIAPLKINSKKVEQHRQSQSLGSIVNKSDSYASKANSPLEELVPSERKSQESTAEFRTPGSTFVRNKYPSTHLSDLVEESMEDVSLREPKRPNDIANGLQFQLPARIAAVKAMQERRRQELEEKAKMPEPVGQHHAKAGRSLAETRDLPSLNFSRMDLIDKLNEALQVRPSKSMDVIRKRDFSAIYCPSPQRPQSTEQLRDRYTSFFRRPEDIPLDELEEHESLDIESEDLSDSLEFKRQSKSSASLLSASRPLSPEEQLLHVATQVNRLSIPSVNNLSERLSELLPSLRNLHLDSVLATDREVAQTIDDIHHLGHIGRQARPDTILSARTSAGFRTLAERAEEIVNNGTHDSLIPALKALVLNKDAFLGSSSVDKFAQFNDGKAPYLSGSVSAPSELGVDLTRPASALTRVKSPTSEEEVLQMLPAEMNPIARGFKRSLVFSSLSSRPWNLDENYPWSSNLAIDLSVPSQAHCRNSTTSVLSCERGTRSLDLTTSVDLSKHVNSSGIDIGSIMELEPTSSVTTEQLTGVVKSHLRKPSKRSILGSIRMRLTNSHAEESTKTTCTRTLSLSDDQPHHPGDRYPTTALTPPTAFNIDEVCSRFSDDSSDRDRRTPKGRRWTALKGRQHSNSYPTRTPSSFDAELTESHPYDAGALNEERAAGANSAAAYAMEGVGMGKAEFRIKRFGEKIRLLIAKGGELFRSLSARSRVRRPNGGVRDEWLEDSLYSVV